MPNEEFVLKIDPEEKISFSSRELGEESVTTTLKIKNPTKDRQILKVKCTSNELFRIRPPVFALAPDEEISVTLAFNSGNTVPDSGKHYFVVYYIKADDENIAPRDCWASHKGEKDGMKRLYVDFIKEGLEESSNSQKKEGPTNGADKKEGSEEKKEEVGGEKKEGEEVKKDDQEEKREGQEEKKEGQEGKNEGQEEKKEDQDGKREGQEEKKEDQEVKKEDQGEKKEEEKKE